MHKDWDDECSWPRRLLHVKTLTSFEWQPGNTYGGDVEPAYNAISYTWGNFRLASGERPDVKAMPFEGIDWQSSLPRMKPECFTTEDLHRAIKVAAKTYLEYPEVNFVWLDIACIDQRNTRDSEAEIGRQVKIFKKAMDTFVWLWDLNCQTVIEWAGNPFSLLAASSRRNPYSEVDRVYGIMQVFDLRLGKSAPEILALEEKARKKIGFTLEELELQLAEALLLKYPIFSQLVLQSPACPIGEALDDGFFRVLALDGF
ncbi:hypothetical protein PG994_004998 [Apiospora phragmitis]|uniref:Heterokaryon incompatibility domain-containing protein n=1 Tax=Apiospora phragmitis TaxID=2905665 RepID=A0ABR1VS61_9PEZI